MLYGDFSKKEVKEYLDRYRNIVPVVMTKDQELFVIVEPKTNSISWFVKYGNGNREDFGSDYDAAVNFMFGRKKEKSEKEKEE